MRYRFLCLVWVCGFALCGSACADDPDVPAAGNSAPEPQGMPMLQSCSRDEECQRGSTCVENVCLRIEEPAEPDDAQPVEEPSQEPAPGPEAEPAMGPEAEPGMEPSMEPEPPPEPGVEPEGSLFGPGPFRVEQTESSWMRDERTISVVSHVPTGITEPVPLVLFLPGFQIESRRYIPLMNHIASHGFVVVRADLEGSLVTVDHVAMTEDMGAVLDWALGEMGPDLVDETRVAATGHSLGGKVSTMLAFRDDRISALFAIDPVNGGDPLNGFVPERPNILPDEIASLEIPMGFPGERINGMATLGPACAPTDMNFDVFFEAAQASPWVGRWNFVDTDHMDFVNDKTNCLFCDLCLPAGTAPEAEVLRGLRGIFVSFLLFHLTGTPEASPYLDGALVAPGIEAEIKP